MENGIRTAKNTNQEQIYAVSCSFVILFIPNEFVKMSTWKSFKSNFWWSKSVYTLPSRKVVCCLIQELNQLFFTDEWEKGVGNSMESNTKKYGMNVNIQNHTQIVKCNIGTIWNIHTMWLDGWRQHSVVFELFHSNTMKAWRMHPSNPLLLSVVLE